MPTDNPPTPGTLGSEPPTTGPHFALCAPEPRAVVSQYHRFWLWPVYDDDTGRLDYWDIHDPNDPRGEANPIAEGLSSKAEARAWVREHLRDTALERTLERALRRFPTGR